jgi:hypothetical protein
MRGRCLSSTPRYELSLQLGRESAATATAVALSPLVDLSERTLSFLAFAHAMLKKLSGNVFQLGHD